MHKPLKFVILILVLLLPVLIFTFLRNFGENKFDVPLQHPNGISIAGCGDYGAPHTVPSIDSLGLSGDNFKLVFISSETIDKKQFNELRRISNNFTSLEILFLTSHEETIEQAGKYSEANWKTFKLENTFLKELNRCGFGNSSGEELILIDAKNHIRGYYSFDRKKELDRLEGEIKILLQ